MNGKTESHEVFNLGKTVIKVTFTKGNLDPKNRDIILRLLRHEHENGRGIILITHDMEIAREAEQVYLLEGGRLNEHHF